MSDTDITRLNRRIVDAAVTIGEVDQDHPAFLHSVLCQLGLPRSRTDARTFTRSSGNASMRIEAGGMFTGGSDWQDMPMPYGTHPRLVLIHVCSEAVRTQNPVIDVSGGFTPFLRDAGVTHSGRAYKNVKRQMTALACSTMTFGWSADDGLHQQRVNPIEAFSAWSDPFTGQTALWPDELVLGPTFFETLCEHAVPLDPRAIRELQHSALAMDCYTWLAHRLCRIRKRNGIVVTWGALRDQFGHEYKTPKDFKKKMKPAIRKALVVYPAARVEEVYGGVRLYSSPSPIRKTPAVARLRRSPG